MNARRIDRVALTEDGRVFAYSDGDTTTAIGRIGRRWFISVGPSDRKDTRDKVDPIESVERTVAWFQKLPNGDAIKGE